MVAAGIDIGSRTIGFVLLDSASGELLHHDLIDSGYDPIARARDHVAQFDYDQIVATGYGRHAANNNFGAEVITEIKAYARGARYVLPDVRTILDIGGQDTKSITLDENGAVNEFQMNEKCAAGTGKFMEVMAVTLGYSMDEFAAAPLQAVDKTLKISSMCAVFAESEVVSLLNSGCPRADVANAVIDSVAQRAAGMLRRNGIYGSVMFAGGGAHNRCLRDKVSALIGFDMQVPSQPQLIGAIGAACEARRVFKQRKPSAEKCVVNL
ncbi:MAG: hypothetical protein B6I36_01685 [Desulfobacteraceae bacterium 4572_35.1]|nr:MAG: hypothetical protein B6I36_01685 [Desulfobacteraceae bacterium 4572_35.1]